MFLHKTDDWRICDYKDKILLKRFAADYLFFSMHIFPVTITNWGLSPNELSQRRTKDIASWQSYLPYPNVS